MYHIPTISLKNIVKLYIKPNSTFKLFMKLFTKCPYLINTGKQLRQDSVILFVPVTFVYNTI